MRSLSLLVFISFFLVSCNGDLVPAKILKISDGDTLRVVLCERITDGECIEASPEKQLSTGDNGRAAKRTNSARDIKLRMLGIDAPEIKQQHWGTKAKNFLETELADDKYIFIETDVEPKDRYGRLLAYVYDSKKVNINEKMLELGLAELYILGENNKYAVAFKTAEAKARENELNIWSKTDGLEMSPSKYRKQQKLRFKKR